MNEDKKTCSAQADRFKLYSANCLLLLIDLQEKLIPAMNQGEQTVRKTGIMVEIAKAMDIPIILTEQYPEGLGPTAQVLRETSGVTAFRKMSFTACTPDVAAAVVASGRRQILVCGMETHVCVYQTVRQLICDGYDVFVLSDAVCSRTEANYRNALQQMSQMGAIITNLETVLFDLLKEAGTPLFKQLSKLIR